MEGSEGTTAVAAVKKVENPNDAISSPPANSAVAAPPMVAVGPTECPIKKKRGRPRKYAPDGSAVSPPPPPSAKAKKKERALLSPMPISASLPAAREFPAMSAAALATALMKQRGGGRPGPGGLVTSKQHQQNSRVVEFENFGDMVSCAAGANFTPHILTVAAGEDVTMKIISFSQEGPRAICILSANGVISNVTLRQSDSSGGTLTYEGRFELLSLSGSFMPIDNGGTRSRSGGMSVSLVGPDGRVVGGGVAGLLVAASPVQVVVGSFLPSYQLEQKTKKPRYNTHSISLPTNAIQMTITNTEDAYGSSDQGQKSATPNRNHTSSSPCRENSWSSVQHSVPDTRNSSTDINVSLPGG